MICTDPSIVIPQESAIDQAEAQLDQLTLGELEGEPERDTVDDTTRERLNRILRNQARIFSALSHKIPRKVEYCNIPNCGCGGKAIINAKHQEHCKYPLQDCSCEIPKNGWTEEEFDKIFPKAITEETQKELLDKMNDCGKCIHSEF
jgi:hypothetical protein